MSLALILLDHLQNIHSTGFVYCDIKLENILIGNGQTLPKLTEESMEAITKTRNVFNNISINLIDFGMSKRFIDKETGHFIPQHDLDVFAGNLFSASIN